MKSGEFDALWDALMQPIRELDKRLSAVERQSQRAETTGGIEVVTTLPTAGQPGRVRYLNGQMYLDNGLDWAGQGVALSYPSQGRLSVSSGVPVPPSDANNYIMYVPHVGNQIALYTGSRWSIYTFTQRSLSLSGTVANKNYDVWAYASSGVVTLELSAWTDDTTRAVNLTRQDAVIVKNGDPTRRYLGTIRTTTAAMCVDSVTQRFVWNLYHHEWRPFYKVDATVHTYQTGAWRAWNNNTANKVEFVLGLTTTIFGGVKGQLRTSTANATSIISVGLDSFTTASTQLGYIHNYNTSDISGGSSGYVAMSQGYHFLGAVEYAHPSYAATFSQVLAHGMIRG